LSILPVQNAVISGRNKYLEILEAAWLDHLAEREPDVPTVISLFAGCGGSSLGYSMAGFRELAAVEWNGNAIETFQLNFPGIQVYGGDICTLTIEDLLEMTELKPGELDVLDGSPPCQGFSTAGKREMTDPRNDLFKDFVRLLRGLQPKVFVMENVSGMVKGKMKLIFAEIMRELKASGYKVSARLLNAMYFNVPQSRERMIFIGVRNDLGIEPSHPGAEGVPFLVRDAFEKCPDDYFPEIKGKWAEIGIKLPQGETGEYFAGKGHGYGMQRLAESRPSPTIRQTMAQSGWACLIHPTEPRVINRREAARLGGYPDSFIFAGNKEYFARIGNSVPPLFMRSIARHIRTEILQRLADMGLEPRLVLQDDIR
jgi:DNA (cytosine-5)-methyltransferase 1